MSEALQTGGTLLLQTLVANDIKMLTGVPAGALGPLIDAMRHQCEQDPSFRNIISTHETLATLSASTFGRFNRWPGVVYLSRKGGADNATLGLTQAQMHGDPLVAIIAQKPSHLLGAYDIQATNLQSDLAHRIKRFLQLQTVNDIPDVMALALQEAIADRPGVVVVEASVPVLRDTTRDTVQIPTVPKRPVQEPSPDTVKDVLATIRRSHKPLVIVGQMAAFESAEEEVKRFVEAIGAVVLLPFRQENLFPWDHEAYVGTLQPRLGSQPSIPSIVDQCDSLFILGDAFNDVTTSSYTLFRDLNIIVHCYPQAGLAKETHPQKMDVSANLRCLLEKINQELERSPHPIDEPWSRQRQAWHDARLQFMQGASWTASGILDLSAVWNYLATFPNATYIRGAGNYDNAHTQYLRTEHSFGTFSGDMGYSLGAALGLALTKPYQTGEKIAVALAGDGEAGMFLFPALLTARQYGLPVKFFIFNDGQYTEVINRTGHSFGAELSGGDLFKLGQTSVSYLERVTCMSQVKPAIQRAYDTHEGPFVVEFDLTG